jgi:hypothetical protein
METKKTAVEFLIEKLDNNLDIKHSWRTKQYIEQAKSIEEERVEHLIKALNVINQMSDCGSYEASIIRMKEIASNAIKNHNEL